MLILTNLNNCGIIYTIIMKKSLNHEHGFGTSESVNKVLAKNVMGQKLRHGFGNGASMSKELETVADKPRVQTEAEQPREQGLGTANLDKGLAKTVASTPEVSGTTRNDNGVAKLVLVWQQKQGFGTKDGADPGLATKPNNNMHNKKGFFDVKLRPLL